MHITTSIQHTVVDDETLKKIEGKFERLAHFLNDPSVRLEVHIIQTTHHHKKGVIFEITAKLHVPHNPLEAHAQDESLYNAADLVKEELERQLLKDKEKHQARFRTTRDKVRAMRGKE